MANISSTIVVCHGNSQWSRFQSLLRGTVLPILLLILWKSSVAAGWVHSSLLPDPMDVAKRTVDMLSSGVLEKHIISSLGRLVIGLACGALPGIAVGVAIGLSRTTEDVLSPTIKFLTPVPVLAWMPLVIIFFGIGEAAKIALLSACVFFVMAAATANDAFGNDQKMLEAVAVIKRHLES